MRTGAAVALRDFDPPDVALGCRGGGLSAKVAIWKIVDHDDSLLALFPSDPVIYHRPEGTEEFGAAETSDGTLRLIGPDEAREVGLQDGTYQQIHLAAQLQKQLDVDADRS